MSREYPEHPIPAVGAVIVQDDRVLLVRRGHEPGLGLWSIPGGAVRLGESLEGALQREIQEETGLSVRPVRAIHVVERILPEGGRIRYHYIIIDYACVVEGGALSAASDALEARWFAWEELGALGLSQGTQKVLELGRRLLARGQVPQKKSKARGPGKKEQVKRSEGKGKSLKPQGAREKEKGKTEQRTGDRSKAKGEKGRDKGGKQKRPSSAKKPSSITARKAKKLKGRGR
jgi:ADP-ribose pyrophosphatase YjhB (NUDIX family)